MSSANTLPLAIIPARAGSKGILNKNIRQLDPNGPNLTELAIYCARDAGIAHRVVTTDIWPFPLSSVKLDLQRPDTPPMTWPDSLSATRWLKRPDELATDTASMLAVVQHALAQIPGPEDQIIVLLQPTQPFRTPAHVQAAIALLGETQADSVVSVVELPRTHNAEAQLSISEWDGQPALEGYCDCAEFPRRFKNRQEREPAYIRDGTVYAFRRETVTEYNNIYGVDVRPLIIPADESCELDTEHDWQEVERRWKVKHA
jgi:CMP-N,N'-diacetyllegionaminic acid synthase